MIRSWLAPKRRRQVLLVGLTIAAALATVIPTINGYSIYSTKPPSGPLAWFANSLVGVHKVDPQYSQACVTHDHYYPIGMTVDQSGWPISFEYDIFTDHYDCLGVFYPIPFAIDFALIAAMYAALLVIVPRVLTLLRAWAAALRKRSWLTTQSGVYVVAILIVATAAAYATSSFSRIVENPSPPPVLSSIEQYEAPFTMLEYLDGGGIPTDITPQLCAGALLPTNFDTRSELFGWPLAYDYDGYDACASGSFYPLVFLADTAFFGVVFGALACSLYWLVIRVAKPPRHV